MSQDPDLNTLLEALPQPAPDPQWLERTRQQLLNACAVAEMPPVPTGGASDLSVERPSPFLRFGRTLFHLSWGRPLAGAAALAACVLLALLLFVPTPEKTFAAIQQQIRSARSVSFQTRLTVEGPRHRLPVCRIDSWVDQQHGARSDFSLEQWPVLQVLFPLEGSPQLIDHVQRQVTEVLLPPDLDVTTLRRLDVTTLLQEMSRYIGPIRRVELTEPPVERGGRAPASPALHGFAFDPVSLRLPADARIHLWVDRASRLPVHIDCQIPLGAGHTLHWTTDAFHWNQPIPAQDLLPPVPAGYQVRPDLVIPSPQEAPLLRTLQRHAELTGGLFPPDQGPPWQTLASTLAALRQRGAFWPTLPPTLHSAAAQRAALGDLIAGGLFYLHLRESGAAPRYFGQSTRHGESDRVLMSWQQRDGRRVVYGDLHTETLAP